MPGDQLKQVEEWRELEEFPRYSINTEGKIYNSVTRKYMRVSRSNYGHAKISLLTDNGRRLDRSVAFLVAKTFLIAPNDLCNRIIYLNGDTADVRAENLAWRPRSFGYRYSRQLKVDLPAYYRNLPVRNMETGAEYPSIVDAGVTEGLLFDHIWRSTYSGSPVFPTASTWEVIK